MGWGRVLLVLSLLVVAVAYFLYTPFPDEAVETREQMTLSILTSALLTMCDFQEYIGYTTMHECARNPFNLIPAQTDKDLSDSEVKITEELFDGVKVRLFVPRDLTDKQDLPALVFYHGGGWIIGSVEQYSLFTKRLSTSLPVIVASVEYRLAPEHLFPIPFEDCVTATKYFMKNAKKFGVDASRIALSGDSAGGNLAMAVGIKLTQERQPPRLLGLFYPALQIVDFKTPSYNTYNSAPYLLRSARMIKFYLRYIFGNDNDLEKFLKNEHITEKMRREVNSKVNVEFLPEKYQKFKTRPEDPKSVDQSLAEKVEKLATNVYMCPLMLDDQMLSQLPKTYLMTCEYDPLRDDGLMLAKRWKDMGFPVKHVHWEGIQHGFFPTPKLNRSREAMKDFIDYLRVEL
ncbi:arylacetamide deacetylase-like [Mizuhopecten yessoensis]|uniref:Arylacetamide deacetylase n=1 Tax=Mizuhopecten yessoensis TaxID=6573 RepID=A0A210PFU6_MIZYE|nr:arylacetamide deacetylase-like [Mizuhopecten yessoensis]XP_021342649.1 arylacetamide deacetylase-like [Mizuhopecten yessoensis]XP_021342650.1 arylacetamide deacetylase-like [Mizuhopecten yessoensis]OWF35358.1 Arylacetamide deacetylase [Mizuhopecten yessoensis]